jgi:hypothetical protein
MLITWWIFANRVSCVGSRVGSVSVDASQSRVDLDPLGSLIPGRPRVQSIGREVTHSGSDPLVAEAQLAADDVVDLVGAVPVRLHPLARFGCLMVDAEPVCLDERAGDEIPAQQLEELLSAWRSGKHFFVGQAWEGGDIEYEGVQSVVHPLSVSQRWGERMKERRIAGDGLVRGALACIWDNATTPEVWLTALSNWAEWPRAAPSPRRGGFGGFLDGLAQLPVENLLSVGASRFILTRDRGRRSRDAPHRAGEALRTWVGASLAGSGWGARLNRPASWRS